MMDFEQANKAVHPVEAQWHYPILTAAGYVPETKEATGFVRRYDYTHPSKAPIRARTGVNGDYWECSTGGAGYWADLEPFLKKM